MNERDYLAERFEEHRTHLRAVAYRMLGSLSEVDDAVQEAWLRLTRTDATSIDNLGGWLTTVVARVCLDMLRSRQSRREEPFTPNVPEPVATGTQGSNPEGEALLADSVGLALLVVLDRLEPAERLAFVLHDMFAVPFEEIAPIVGRSADATRQLASRARRRVRGGAEAPNPDVARQREVIDAFLAALRGGDFQGLLAVLDPDLVVRADMAGALPLFARGLVGAGSVFLTAIGKSPLTRVTPITDHSRFQSFMAVFPSRFPTPAATFFPLVMSQSISEWMFRAILVML